MRQIAMLVSVAALVLTGCQPETSSHTLLVKGSVATGAHPHTRAPVTGGWVGLLMPQGPNGGHWIRLGFDSSSGVASEVAIQSDGTYAFRIDVIVFNHPEAGYPIYVAASDAAQTLTMISELPRDLGVEDATLGIDINPSTTAAGQLICPGGTQQPPQNTWCYSDPKAPSADNRALVDIVDNALGGDLPNLEPGSPPAWGQFASGLLNDPPTFERIKANLSGQGIVLGGATPASIAAAVAPLPPVHPGRATPPATSSGSSGSCRLVWDCKTSSQCAQVYGGRTGSADEPDAATCQSICKMQGACTCQGC